MRKIWIEDRIPEDWNKGITVLICKKGDRKQCGNCRGLTLWCQTFRMALEIKGKLAEELYAFRRGEEMEIWS
jgi:hypothetical protein